MIRAGMLFVSIVLFASQGYASHRKDLKPLFEKIYAEEHIPNRCGLNSLNFLETAEKQFKKAESLYIIRITNTGFSTLGAVNAEHARGDRFGKPSIEEAKWMHHHTFVMDDDGYVYDTSFDIRPRVLTIKRYLDEMFLSEPDCDKTEPVYGEPCVGRDVKLSEYEMTSIQGSLALTNPSIDESEKFTMQQVYDNWRVLTEQ